jgi:hypothetical protein
MGADGLRSESIGVARQAIIDFLAAIAFSS